MQDVTCKDPSWKCWMNDSSDSKGPLLETDLIHVLVKKIDSTVCSPAGETSAFKQHPLLSSLPMQYLTCKHTRFDPEQCPYSKI